MASTPGCSGGIEPDRTDHVDHFIWERYRHDRYARFVLMLMRLPAAMQADFADQLLANPLYCTFHGVRHRVLMASRFGDIGLGLPNDAHYHTRVLWHECSDWSATP